MAAPPVIDQEFVVHLFAPAEGPQARAAYRQLRQMWAACGDRLGISQPVAGLPGPALPAGERLAPDAADGVLAAKEVPGSDRQAVLRREHDVASLSVSMAQPEPEGRPARFRGQLGPLRHKPDSARSPLVWPDYSALWAQVSQPRAGALIGEARLFLARALPGRTGPVAATADLGEVLHGLLPYREDRARQWWSQGITTSAGYAVWDTGLAPDTSPLREIIVVAPADRDEEVSGWAWSDWTTALPPLARYLMHAGKLRFQVRLLDAWHQAGSTGAGVAALTAELDAALEAGRRGPGDAAGLDSLRGRLRTEEQRLGSVDGELARVGQALSLAQENLLDQPGCATADGCPGLFAADQKLGTKLAKQVSSDRAYLAIELADARRAAERALEELEQIKVNADAPSAGTDPAASGHPDVSRKVFVVYGRDAALTDAFFDLLHGVGLEPLDWETIVGSLDKPMPFLAEAVLNAPKIAQAALVLMSPDDIVELHPELYAPNDHPYERGPGGQARPNVLFELGLAYMAYPDRTVIVEAGLMRPIADLGGLNVIRFGGSALDIRKVLERLRLAGCPVDLSLTDWLKTSRFENLASYKRGPGGGPGNRAPGDGGA